MTRRRISLDSLLGDFLPIFMHIGVAAMLPNKLASVSWSTFFWFQLISMHLVDVVVLYKFIWLRLSLTFRETY